jgi:hypothetical protein
MSHRHLLAVAECAALRPTQKPWLLAAHHVPTDELLAHSRGYEALALRRLTASDATAVAIIGPSGAGKSSFIAWVGAQLPETHIAIRLPVSALSDPTDVGECLRLSLGTILDLIALDREAREDVHVERADRRSSVRAATGMTSWKFGGGSIPVEVAGEVGSLRQEFEEDKLDGEYLSAVHRVVAILRARGVTPVFVFEDTEAIVGNADEATRVEGFFEGPMRSFLVEIDAPCLIAVQRHLAESPAYVRLAASLEVIELPHLGDEAKSGLARILERQLELSEVDCELADILGEDALDGLVQFYDDMGGDLRKTLAAAHNAAEEAAAMSAERIRATHVRIGAAHWR